MRILNIRPLFVAFVALVLGIITYIMLFLSQEVVQTIVGMVGIFILISSLVLFVLSYVLKPTNPFSKIITLHKQTFLILLVFILAGVGVMSVSDKIYNTYYPTYNDTYYVVGEINDDYYEEYGYTFLTLNNVVITDNTSTYNLPGKVNVVLFTSGLMNSSQVSAKNLMEFNAKISKTPFFNDNYNFSYYVNKNFYSAEIVGGGYTFYEGSFSVNEYIKSQYRTVISDYMSPELSNIGYSLLFGNDEALSSETLDLFVSSGIVHIISVSGLHVAVLVAALVFLLKKLKANKVVQFIVIFIILAFYAYLCGFVPSVVRSAFMSLIFLLALGLGKRYDALSALGFAGIAILLVSPVQLFGIGFQLSFVALFALISVMPLFNKLFVKWHLPKWLYVPISATLSVTLLTYPILAYYFNQIAVYSVLSNLVVVPIMSLAYILIFLISSLAVFINFFGFILLIPNILLHFSNLILNLIASLPLSVLKVYSDGYVSLLLLLLAVFLFRYLMVNKKLKTVLVSVLLFVFIFANVFYNLPQTYYYNSLNVSYQNDSNISLITTSEGKNVLVGSAFTNTAYLDNLTEYLKINKIDTVIAYDFTFGQIDMLKSIVKEFDVQNLYVYYLDTNLFGTIQDNFNDMNVVVISSTQTYSVSTLQFNAVIDVNKVLALQITVADQDILVVKSGLSVTDLNILSLDVDREYDVILVNRVYSDLYALNFNTTTLITQSNNTSEFENVYNIKQLNDFTYKL